MTAYTSQTYPKRTLCRHTLWIMKVYGHVCMYIAYSTYHGFYILYVASTHTRRLLYVKVLTAFAHLNIQSYMAADTLLQWLGLELTPILVI